MASFHTHISPTSNRFVVRLSSDPTTAFNQIMFLQNNSFIDIQTRAIVVSLNTFNPSLNMFLSSVWVSHTQKLFSLFSSQKKKKITEFATGGNTMMDASMRPLLADFYLTTTDWFRCGVEIVFLIWLIGHIIQFAYIVRGGKKSNQFKIFIHIALFLPSDHF